MTAPAPCGVCLQVMSEFCKADEFEIVMAKSEEDYRSKRLSNFCQAVFPYKGWRREKRWNYRLHFVMR